jgi:hypothetical protein
MAEANFGSVRREGNCKKCVVQRGQLCRCGFAKAGNKGTRDAKVDNRSQVRVGVIYIGEKRRKLLTGSQESS